MSKLSFTSAARIAATTLLVMSTAGVALAADELKLTNAAFQEKPVETASGEIKMVRVPVAKVTPGTEVIYVVTYENIGDEVARNVTITNPVPSVMNYVPMSVAGRGTTASFSADGGASYASLSSLTVANSDGSLRQASSDDITNVRWQLRSPVSPGSAGTVEYRARLK